MAALRSSRLIADTFRQQQQYTAQTVCRRGFTSTRRAREPITDLVLAGPTAVINLIHGAGIPYYAALPLTAVFVRSTIVYYLAVRPARRQARLLHNLRPLIDAKSVLLRETEGRKFRRENRETLVEDSSRGVHQLVQLRWRIRYWWLRFATQRKYLRDFGKPWYPWGLVNFGILIAFTESIRLKCGRSEGLLSLLLRPIERLPAIMNAGLARMGITGSSGVSVDGPMQDPDSTQTLASVPTSGPSTSYFDPAMQVEGFDFCVDLTQVDPTGILPTTAGLILIATVLLRSKPAAKAQNTSSQPREGINRAQDQPQIGAIAKLRSWRLPLTNLERIGLLFAGFFALILQSFPAGIVLYMGPHFLVGWLQRRWLDRRDPMPEPITACKRPLWLDSRREW